MEDADDEQYREQGTLHRQHASTVSTKDNPKRTKFLPGRVGQLRVDREDARVGGVNTKDFRLSVLVLASTIVIGLTGCSARAPEANATAQSQKLTPASTQSNPQEEAAPASLETFNSLLDCA